MRKGYAYSDLLSPFISTYVSDSDYTTIPLADGTYNWRILARDLAGNPDPWSSVRNVTIDSVGPSPISPLPRARINDTTPTFDWDDEPGATEYRLQVDDSDFMFPIPPYLVNISSGSTMSNYTIPSGNPLNEGIYYWRVRAKVGGAWGGWRSYGFSYNYFIIDTTPPPAPTLLSPLNNSFINILKPFLNWSDVNEAVLYQIQLDSPNSAFNSPIVYATTSYSNFSVPFRLKESQYSWRVRTKDHLDFYPQKSPIWGPWSNVSSFTLDTESPPIPTLTFPFNGSIINDNTPHLGWDLINEAIQYQIQVDDTNSSMNSLINDSLLIVNNTQVQLIPDGTYFWRVRAEDNAGNWGPWSISWSFTVDTIAPLHPNNGTIIRPMLGDNLFTNFPLFIWDPVDDATTYWLQVAVKTSEYSNNFTQPLINVTLADTNITVFVPDGLWYWRVKASDTVGNWGNWTYYYATQFSSFYIDTTGPSPPTLTSPTDGMIITSNSTQISWFADDPGVNSQLSLLQVSDSEAFGNLLINQTYGDGANQTTIMNSSQFPDGLYFWKVRSFDGMPPIGNWGDWSEVQTFIIDTAPPLPPSLISPVNGVYLEINMPSLAWNFTNDTTYYQLQIATSDSFSNLIFNSTVDNALYNLTTPLANGTYYWRVRAQDIVGNLGSWSSIWSFIIGTTSSESTSTTTTPTGTSTTTISTSVNGTPGFTFIVMWLLLIPSILRIKYRKRN